MMKSSEPRFSSAPAETLWIKVRESAAMLGAFNPLQLIGLPDTTKATEVLTALGHECVEIVAGETLYWQLVPDSRRRILATLQADGRLELVAKAAHPDDSFGRYLVDAVLGQLRVPTSADLVELGAIHSAIQFAGSIEDREEEIALVDQAVAHLEAEEAIRWLLPRGLKGRDHQLRLLRRFVGEPQTAVPALLMISGTGGVGKSALLAEFARRLKRWKEKPPLVVWLDFDRALLAQTDQGIMLQEVARQLALDDPALAPKVAAFRRGTESRFDVSSDVETANQTSHSFRFSAGWSLWREYGLADAARDRPLVLILDTLEEILVGDDGRGFALTDWLSALATEGGFNGLRAILSGRSEGPFDEWGVSLGAPHIKLGDLGPVSAVRLLKAELGAQSDSLADETAEALVEHYGANPLTLKVLARFLRTEGPHSAAALLEEAGNRTFKAQFAQQYLYKRILGRVRSDNSDLVAVAHPGLVLRRVTPDLIRTVLAEPCGLLAVDMVSAERLFDALAQQIWLVEPDAQPRAVRHRRDLRRLIFGSMNETDAEKALAIHRMAAAYYADYKDPALTVAEQDVEALYHRVFAEPGLNLDDAALLSLASTVGEDSADFPLSYRARLKQLTGRTLRLDEKETLTADARFEADEATARDALRRGVVDWPTRNVGSAKPSNPSIAAEEAYTAGDLDELVEIGPWVVDEFVEEVLLAGWRSRRMPADLTEFAMWRLALSMLGKREEKRFAVDLINRFLDVSRQVEWERPLNPNRKQSITLGNAAQSMIYLLGSNPPNFLARQSKRDWYESELGTTEMLRARQLLRRDPDAIRGGRGMRVSIALMRFLSPGYANIDKSFARSGITIHPIAQDAIEAVHRASESRRPSLSDLERPRARQAFLEVLPGTFANPASAERLRGMSPELYPLLQATAREVDADELVSFARDIGSRLSVWPRELTSRQFESSLRRDRERWTATLIQTADRCGELSNLMDHLCVGTSSRSQGRRIGKMIKIYNRRLLS